MTRYNTGRDGCSPFRRIFGKLYDGCICKFGEQVHYKLGGRPSSRIESRWELGCWGGKMELTDEHLLGTLAGIRSNRTIYRLPKSHCFNKDAQTPKPDGAARDPIVRRQYITQRWVDENGVTPGCPRCEGRGTMSHSETCRKRFEAIEKRKLDKQLEEATRNAEPPPVSTVEKEVEQPQELPSTGGASSSSGPVPSGQEAVPLASPCSHEVRMEVTGPSGSTRPLEWSEESSNKRVRILAGMLLFDENDTSDWQHSIREAHMSELSNDQDIPENIIDDMQQPDTDIPGEWGCQVEPKSDLYGDRTGMLMDPETMVKGRLTELKHMNDHHVYDWIDEADIDGDETKVRSRVVVQQYNSVKRDEVHQGTPPLKVLRMLLASATSKDAHRRKVWNLGRQRGVFFHSLMDEYTVVRPPPGVRVKGKLWVLNRALHGTRMVSRFFGKLVAGVLTDARFETVSSSTERH